MAGLKMDESIKKRLDIGVEELLLVILIILYITEFTGLLPADLDYTKKIISWVALGYLLYKANPTEIIFGYKDKLIDALLIIAYFFLVIKNFILFSKTALEGIGQAGSFLIPLYTFLLDNAFTFELITFYIGGGMIILLALLNLFLNTEIKEPSIMAIFHREGPAKSLGGRAARTLSSFIIYSAFFVIVFNLVMEWLAWAVDSTLAVVAIFFYLFFFIKHFRKLSTGSFLYKVGDVGEDFYEKFINLFHSKRTLLLGVTGLLVLHLLTDTGNFILPYVIGKKINYFVALGAGHTVIPHLLSIDLGIAATAALKMSVLLVYMFNIAAMLFLFIGPAFVWYEMYKEKKIELPHVVYSLFSASFFIFLVSPVFRIQRMSAADLYGVDILTKTITVSNSIMVMSAALVIFVVILALSYTRAVKDIIRYICVFLVEGFFAYYILLFFMDVASFYAKSFVLIGNYFILFYLSIFMIITIFFYLGGIIYFVYDTIVDIIKI